MKVMTKDVFERKFKRLQEREKQIWFSVGDVFILHKAGSSIVWSLNIDYLGFQDEISNHACIFWILTWITYLTHSMCAQNVLLNRQT